MENWVIFGTKECPWCLKAIDLLKERDKQFEYFDIHQYPVLKVFMEVSGMKRTVPQVFLNGHLIGGYDTLADYLQGADYTFN